MIKESKIVIDNDKLVRSCLFVNKTILIGSGDCLLLVPADMSSQRHLFKGKSINCIEQISDTTQVIVGMHLEKHLSILDLKTEQVIKTILIPHDYIRVISIREVKGTSMLVLQDAYYGLFMIDKDQPTFK